MGTRKQREKQEDLWIARTELATATRDKRIRESLKQQKSECRENPCSHHPERAACSCALSLYVASRPD
jgi:hypothetical protein